MVKHVVYADFNRNKDVNTLIASSTVTKECMCHTRMMLSRANSLKNSGRLKKASHYCGADETEFMLTKLRDM